MVMVMVHGGLWEDMDAERFWVRPGVVDGLAAAGMEVLAPDRLVRPDSWAAEVRHLRAMLPDKSLTVLAGSNGCSVAARLAVDDPDRVARLVLAWPATAGDPRVDAWTREQGAPEAMLVGETLRGLTDTELAGLSMPVAVLPAYKRKWDPITLPEYIAFSDGASLRGFLSVFRAANAL